MLYGYVWPKTTPDDTDDEEERELDHRRVHRFLDPVEEARARGKEVAPHLVRSKERERRWEEERVRNLKAANAKKGKSGKAQDEMVGDVKKYAGIWFQRKKREPKTTATSAKSKGTQKKATRTPAKLKGRTTLTSRRASLVGKVVKSTTPQPVQSSRIKKGTGAAQSFHQSIRDGSARQSPEDEESEYEMREFRPFPSLPLRRSARRGDKVKGVLAEAETSDDEADEVQDGAQFATSTLAIQQTNVIKTCEAGRCLEPYKAPGEGADTVRLQGSTDTGLRRSSRTAGSRVRSWAGETFM
jgi:hypothetical protein